MTPFAELTRRQQNILRRLANHDTFFSKNSPRMTQAEFRDLSKAGYSIQCESCHGANTSAGLCYSQQFNAEAMAEIKAHSKV